MIDLTIQLAWKLRIYKKYHDSTNVMRPALPIDGSDSSPHAGTRAEFLIRKAAKLIYNSPFQPIHRQRGDL